MDSPSYRSWYLGYRCFISRETICFTQRGLGPYLVGFCAFLTRSSKPWSGLASSITLSASLPVPEGSVFAFLHVMIGFLDLHANMQTCLQVFPIHAFTLRCSPNGAGSLPNAGIGDKRHGYFQYVWIGCPSRYIPLGWISHSERFAHYLIVQVKFNLLKDFAHG